MWELGEWQETGMESPWRYAENPKLAPFDQQVRLSLLSKSMTLVLVYIFQVFSTS